MEEAKPVEYSGKEYDVVKEGLAEILSPRQDNDIQPSKKRKNGEDVSESPAQAVFYNPIQQFNRDLSVLVIKLFSQDLAVIRQNRHERRLEALARKRQRKGRGKTRSEAAEAGTITQNPIQDNDALDSVVALSESPAKAAPSQEPENSTFSVDLNNEQVLNTSKDLVSDPKANPSDTATRTVASTVNRIEMTAKEIQGSTLADGGPNRGPPSLEQSLNREKERPDGPKTILPELNDIKFRICDALSASGLRAIRYAKEIPLATQITANDLSPTATASIALNIHHNGLQDKVIPTTSEAQLHLSASASKSTSKYEVVDLDPYGTAVPFLDSAIQALVDGGLLCVTCTDASLFASMGYLEKTFTLYRGLPFKGQQSHEVGLRLILNTVATSAASYGIAIEPLLSISADFYVRLFIRVRRTLSDTKFQGGKTMVLYYCGEGCGAFCTQPFINLREKTDKIGQPMYKYTQARAPTTTPTCEHCDYKLHIAGPMWGGPIHNPHFVQRILDMLPDLDPEIYGTIPRIKGMLTMAQDEVFLPEDTIALAPSTQETAAISNTQISLTRPIPSLLSSYVDPAPLFVHLPSLCKALHCTCPPDAAFRGALLGLGYRVSRSHTSSGSIKTDAPWSIIWEVMREWIRQKAPVKQGAIAKGTAGWGLMKRDRSNVRVATLREEVEAVLKEKHSLTDVTDGIQGALYRAINKQTTSNQEVNGMKCDHHEVDGSIESSNGQGTFLATDNSQAQAENEPLLRIKEKRTRERNTYKQEHKDSSSDRAFPRKPTMIHPDHQPLTALQRSELNIVFDEKLGSESEVRGLVRYQVNPRENWGPIKKAKIG